MKYSDLRVPVHGVLQISHTWNPHSCQDTDHFHYPRKFLLISQKWSLFWFLSPQISFTCSSMSNIWKHRECSFFWSGFVQHNVGFSCGIHLCHLINILLFNDKRCLIIWVYSHLLSILLSLDICIVSTFVLLSQASTNIFSYISLWPCISLLLGVQWLDHRVGVCSTC